LRSVYGAASSTTEVVPVPQDTAGHAPKTVPSGPRSRDGSRRSRCHVRHQPGGVPGSGSGSGGPVVTSTGAHFGLYRHAEVFHSTTLISSLNPSATAAWIAIGRTSRVRSKAHRTHWMTSLSKDAPLKPATGPPRPYLTAHRHITPGAPVAGVVSRETVTAPPAYVRWRPSCSTLVRYLPSSWKAHSTAAALHSMPVLPAVTPGAPQSSRKNHHGVRVARFT
jgi:hypothetical protein